MGKSQKAFLVIFIMLLLGFNVILVINSFYSYTFSYAIETTVKSFIPLIILLTYYFITTRHIEKLSVNYIFLIISLLSFAIIIICKILYYSLIIDDEIYEFLYLLYIPAILLLVLTFSNNFLEDHKYFLHFRIVVSVALILQLYLSFDYIFANSFCIYYTNPNRYELVKYHYFSDERFLYLPNKIPDDATNIEFYCEPKGSYDSKKSLHLEYDSPSVPNDTHHAYFNIVIP